MRKKEELTKTQQKIIAVASVLILILITGMLMWVVGGPLLRFVTEPEKFRQWVEQNGIWGPVLYVFCVILQVLVALIPGEPLELVGGYAFGAVEGSLLCLAGAAAGSVLVFSLVRRYGVRLVEVFYSAEKLKELRFLKNSPKRTVLFCIIFIIPGTPKDLLCYFAGLTDMRFQTFLLISILGRLPSLLTSTIGGGALGAENYISAIGVLLAAMVLGVVGLFLYRYICRKHNREPKHFKKFVNREYK